LYYVSFVIRTSVSIKKEFKKIRNKKFQRKEKRKNRKVKEEEKGLYCGLLTENSVYLFRFLGIYIPATLYISSTSNHLIFSTVVSLV